MTGRISVFLASALLSAPALSAQVPLSVSSDVSVHSAYEARGLTYTEGAVLQAALDVGSRLGAFELTVGAWANVEPFGSATGRRMLPAGVSGPSEINLYAGITRELGIASLELGTIRFLFPNGFDFSQPRHLTEFYGSIAAAVWAEPTVTAYYDLEARGWYGELKLRRQVPTRFGHGWLGAELGASHGQADPDEYYGRNGLTHAGLAGGVEWNAGAVTVAPEIRWTRAIDEEALLRSSVTQRASRSKGVLAFRLSWAADGRSR